jgi:hypothetical protein
MTLLTGLFGMGFEVPPGQFDLMGLLTSLCVLLGVYIVYKLRKIPPFNIIWMFLVAIFIYALLGYAGKKIKEWWRE